MKIKFLKDSPDGKHKAKDTANINDWRAKYWVRTGVANEVEEKEATKKATTSKKEKKAPAKAETKNAAPNTETK